MSSVKKLQSNIHMTIGIVAAIVGTTFILLVGNPFGRIVTGTMSGIMHALFPTIPLFLLPTTLWILTSLVVVLIASIVILKNISIFRKTT